MNQTELMDFISLYYCKKAIAIFRHQGRMTQDQTAGCWKVFSTFMPDFFYMFRHPC
jgi:hypothetical protein